MATKNVYKKQITVTSTEKNPVPLEILADEIKAVSNGIKKLYSGPLKRRAIVLLLKDCTPGVTMTQIENIMDSMDALAQRFLK